MGALLVGKAKEKATIEGFFAHRLQQDVESRMRKILEFKGRTPTARHFAGRYGRTGRSFGEPYATDSKRPRGGKGIRNQSHKTCIGTRYKG